MPQLPRPRTHTPRVARRFVIFESESLESCRADVAAGAQPVEGVGTLLTQMFRPTQEIPKCDESKYRFY